ncbi:MAG: hypothetical protein ACQESG_02980 [Nanobdellota archaeon]
MVKHRRKTRRQKGLRDGPKSSIYFFSYSQNMLGRAIIDSGIYECSTDKITCDDNLVLDFKLPVIPNDWSAEYGVIYFGRNRLEEFSNLFKGSQFRSIGKCEPNSLEKRLTFLEDTEDMHEYFEWVDYYEGEFPGFEKLPSRFESVKVNNLGEFLYYTLHPKIGAVYRHSEAIDPIQVGMEILGYTPTVQLKGISRHRYQKDLCCKEARNKNPHKVIPYYGGDTNHPYVELLRLAS